VSDLGALLIPGHSFLSPVAVEGSSALDGWCCREEAQVGRLSPAVGDLRCNPNAFEFLRHGPPSAEDDFRAEFCCVNGLVGFKQYELLAWRNDFFT